MSVQEQREALAGGSVYALRVWLSPGGVYRLEWPGEGFPLEEGQTLNITVPAAGERLPQPEVGGPLQIRWGGAISNLEILEAGGILDFGREHTYLARVVSTNAIQEVVQRVPLLGLATTRELLSEISCRMEITQNSTRGRELGALCNEALFNLAKGVLDYTTVGHHDYPLEGDDPQ